MINAKELRKISEKASSATISQNVKIVLDQIERNIKEAAFKGKTSFTENVDMMLLRSTAAFRRIIALKLKDLGFSYEENKKENSIWFTVSW